MTRFIQEIESLEKELFTEDAGDRAVTQMIKDGAPVTVEHIIKQIKT